MKYIVSLSILVFLSCSPQKPAEEEKTYEAPSHHSATLTKVFDAHGGYEQWQSMNALSYNRGEESTITNLQNRKIRLESPEQTIGFDGKDVWVTPDTLNTERARFFHNLYFYFYAMPFVVGDPGANYEDLEPKELDGKTYNGIKISYGDGVGDSPDDNYIIWLDPETNRMEWLMYTVTFRSGEANDNYRLIKYGTWEEFNGLSLPTSIQWFQFQEDTVGSPRGEATLFENIKISTEIPDESLFAIPEGAAIAPLNNAANM